MIGEERALGPDNVVHVEGGGRQGLRITIGDLG